MTSKEEGTRHEQCGHNRTSNRGYENASWINPADGKATPLGPLPNQGVKSFTTPDGWEDSLLVIESPGSQVNWLGKGIFVDEKTLRMSFGSSSHQ